MPNVSGVLFGAAIARCCAAAGEVAAAAIATASTAADPKAIFRMTHSLNVVASGFKPVFR
jgi:hypothetical protein